MRRLTTVAILALVCSTAEAQRSPYRSVRVRSCPYADSLLGPLRDDYRGQVRAFYHKERDSTYLLSGGEAEKPRITISIKLAGQRPARAPVAQVAAFLRGAEASLVETTRDALEVTLVLDDTVTVQPEAAALGTFIGPKEMIVLPVSALLPMDDLLRAARAQRIAVNAKVATIAFTPTERQELRAIIRTAVCPP